MANHSWHWHPQDLNPDHRACESTEWLPLLDMPTPEPVLPQFCWWPMTADAVANDSRRCGLGIDPAEGGHRLRSNPVDLTRGDRHANVAQTLWSALVQGLCLNVWSQPAHVTTSICHVQLLRCHSSSCKDLALLITMHHTLLSLTQTFSETNLEIVFECHHIVFQTIFILIYLFFWLPNCIYVPVSSLFCPLSIWLKVPQINIILDNPQYE